MKSKSPCSLSLFLLAGWLLSACIPAGSAPQGAASVTETEQSIPQTGGTDTPAAPTSAPTNAANDDPTSAPTGTDGEDPAAYKAWLSENIASRNYAELRKLMGDQFFFGMWRSEAGMETPDNAIRLLRDFFGENHVEFVPPQDASAVLGFDPLSILKDPLKGGDILLARKVGTEGKDGAVLYIAQKPDGSYTWYGLLVIRGGF